MALSVSSYGQSCVPPTSFVSLAYDPLSPNNINNSNVFKTYSTNGLAINQNKLTIPTQCTTGLDIVFLVDYTGSMDGAINGVKAGIANILSTIDSESLGNYRVGLCIFDEYAGNLTSPPSNNYGQTSTYLNLPASQKAVINTFNNRTQFITCMQPLGNVGSITDFQTKLNLLATPSFPLGYGQGAPEPGGLGINEILSNNIAGSFRSDAIKLIILITDDVPGGNDDVNNSTDQTYFEYNLLGICNSYDAQLMVQSSLASTYPGNYYYGLSTATTPAGRYDQVTFDSNGNWINTGLISGIQTLCDNSYIATCETAPCGWYYEAGAAYAVYYDCELGYVTDEYWFPPTYSISANKTQVNEENVKITFVVDTQYLNASPTTLWWELGPYNANASDLVEAINNGYVVITTTSGVNGQGVFELTTKSDNLTEGDEWLIVKLTNASSIVLDTVNVRILDSSLNLPTATPIPPTATAVPCYTYNFQLTDSWNSGYIQYTMCDGRSDTVYLTPYSQPVVLCVKAIAYYQNIIITQIGSQCYSSSGAGAGYPTATPIPPTPTPIPPTPTATPVPAPTATPVPAPTATELPLSSYIAERNDGGEWGYVGPYNAVYTTDDSVYLNDGSGICWTLGTPTTANYTYAIIDYCYPDPTSPPNPTPQPTTPPSSDSEVWQAAGCNDRTTLYIEIQGYTEPYLGMLVGVADTYWDYQTYELIRPSTRLADYTSTGVEDFCKGDTGGGCLVAGTLVKLVDGTYSPIEDLQINQELASVSFGNLPDTDNIQLLSAWSESDPILSNTTTRVLSNNSYEVDVVLNINNGLLKASKTHLHIVKRNDVWSVLRSYELMLGDILLHSDMEQEIEITNLDIIRESYTVYKLDVEFNDTFIANNIITHNVGIKPSV